MGTLASGVRYVALAAEQQGFAGPIAGDSRQGVCLPRWPMQNRFYRLRRWADPVVDLGRVAQQRGQGRIKAAVQIRLL